jgi:hypothetical protein
LTWLFLKHNSPNCLSFVEHLFERVAQHNSPNFQRSATYNFLRRAVANDYPSLQRAAGRQYCLSLCHPCSEHCLICH